MSVQAVPMCVEWQQSITPGGLCLLDPSLGIFVLFGSYSCLWISVPSHSVYGCVNCSNKSGFGLKESMKSMKEKVGKDIYNFDLKRPLATILQVLTFVFLKDVADLVFGVTADQTLK
jgi:hypothetical protein